MCFQILMFLTYSSPGTNGTNIKKSSIPEFFKHVFQYLIVLLFLRTAVIITLQTTQRFVFFWNTLRVEDVRLFCGSYKFLQISRNTLSPVLIK